MADGAGPACFGQCRSLSLEEVVDLWPRIRPAATSSRALAKSAGSELEDAKRQRHRMLSVRLYPPEELSNLPAKPSQPSCCRSLTRREESSLVLSLIHEVGGGEKTGGSAADVKLEALLESAGRPAAPGKLLHWLWRRLLGRRDVSAEQLLCQEGANLVAAVLLDGQTGDVVALPTPWHVDLERKSRKACALRRLLYWMHALPPLDARRPQQYVCTDSLKPS
ncbi:unnamed protein product [Polarella glacialis]|uniref:Uncharacterized protein n=1 Tax=Polarella glacialis TaxID=89957 RepID=A0A813DWD7_POLGL|nr:unnamed protein product [Polarella glacialis]